MATRGRAESKSTGGIPAPGYHSEKPQRIDLPELIFEGRVTLSRVEKAGLNLPHIPVTDKGKDLLGFIFEPKHFSMLFVLPIV